jgi:hypothetical protein
VSFAEIEPGPLGGLCKDKAGGSLQRRVGEPCQGSGHGLAVPGACNVGHGNEQRHAVSGNAQVTDNVRFAACIRLVLRKTAHSSKTCCGGSDRACAQKAGSRLTRPVRNGEPAAICRINASAARRVRQQCCQVIACTQVFNSESSVPPAGAGSLMASSQSGESEVGLQVIMARSLVRFDHHCQRFKPSLPETRTEPTGPDRRWR